jgi:hypothetical protein
MCNSVTVFSFRNFIPVSIHFLLEPVTIASRASYSYYSEVLILVFPGCDLYAHPDLFCLEDFLSHKTATHIYCNFCLIGHFFWYAL